MAALTGVALAGVALAGCAPAPETESERSLVVATSQIPGTWDPFENGLMLATPAAQGAYEPLIQDEGYFSPALAKSWELSEDTTSIEYTLHENVTFADGTHLTAEVVADVLTTIFSDPNFPLAYLVTGDHAVTVEATGEYTVRMTRESTVADYDWRPESIPYGWLSFVPIVSPAALADRSLFEEGPQGTGPYLVEDLQPDVSVTYVRNPDYWNPDAYPYDTVTFVQYDDAVAILNALKSGEVDTGVVGPELVQEAEDSGLNVQTGLGVTTWLEITDLDGSIHPQLGDVRVRQAMAMALDRTAIGDAINHGYGYATSQLFTDDAYEYVEGGDDRYAFDPEQAKELLAEAGYPDGFDLVIPNYAESGADAYLPVIQQYLGDIGIRVTYNTVQASDIGSAWAASGIAIVGLAIASGDPQFFLPDNYLNHDWGPDPEINRLVDVAKTGTEEERIQALKDMGPALLEEARFITIGYVPKFYVSQEDVNVTLLNPFARSAFLAGYTPEE